MGLQLTPNISFYDKSFNEAHTRDYSLFIQLGLKELALAVYNPEKNTFIGFESFRFDKLHDVRHLPSAISEVFLHIGWFSYPFKSVVLMYQNTFSTLIPHPLFSEEQSSLYLEFNQPEEENSRIVNDKLKNNQAVNIYYLPNPVVEKIKSIWPNIKILHFSTALIESLSINFKNIADDKTLFVNLREDCFDVVYFKENKLHFYNSFKFLTKEDFIYFLLITIDQLNLNPENINLIISGKIDKQDENYNMINQYIKNYTLIPRNKNYGYSYVLDELRYHQYYVLFNALQCE